MKPEPITLPLNWRTLQLAHLVKTLSAGVSVNSEDRNPTAGEIGILKTSCVYSGVFRPSECKAVVPDDVGRARVSVRANHLIVSRMNTPGLVGASGFVEKSAPKLFLPDRLWQLETEANVDARWLAFVLGSDRYRILLREIATGTSQSMKNISRSSLLALPIDTPSHNEQRRIAKILSTWDEAIADIARLVEHKSSQFCYLNKNLISWSCSPRRQIGQLISAVSRPVSTPTAAYRALGIRSHGKGTFQRTVERPEEIDMEIVYVVGPRDLIVNITFAWEGAIALATDEDAGCFVSHRFPTFEINEDHINRDFLGYVVRSSQFIHKLGIASPGGAGRNRVLSKRNFLKIEIPVPPKVEQDRIAAILGASHREISLLKAEAAAVRRQKRGLMQKLLTGEWRVPVRDGDVDEMAARAAEEAVQ